MTEESLAGNRRNGAQVKSAAPPISLDGAMTRTQPTAAKCTPPGDVEAEECAIIRTLIEHPNVQKRTSLASQLLGKVEVIDFQEPSHALIVKAAKECKADKLDTTTANLEATLAAATHGTPIEERSALIAAIATLQEIALKEYSEETGTQAKRHTEKLAADFEKRIAATATPEPEPAFKLYSIADLRLIPRPKSLIYRVLVEGTASALTAKSGDYKSFISLSMALSIATGRDWYGHEVKQGNVVYVAAEGFYTILDRLDGWAQFHNCELPKNFHAIKAPVNLADVRTVAAFRDSVADFKPDFIVLDTLSQCAIGMNENDNAQMADFVRGMMSLGNEIGAHVQVLHHNAKSTGTFRGAGSIIANIDTHISLDRPENDPEGNTIFVRCEKQRGEPFEAFALRAEKVFLPYADEKGNPISTLVFEPCGEVVTAKVEKHANSKRAEATRAALMEVFDRQFDEATAKGFDGVKVGFWKEAAIPESEPEKALCSSATFWAYRAKLENDGTIVQCGTHKGSPVYQRGKATPTTPTTPKQSTQSAPISESKEYSNNSNNPLGVGVVGVPRLEGRKKSKINLNGDHAYASTDSNVEEF